MIGFDWDGTLVETFTAQPLPGVAERLAALPAGARTFVASNQAGPIYRALTGQDCYPTVDQVAHAFAAALDALGWRPDLLLVCVALIARPLPQRLRGVAPTWRGLNGRWAVPGTDYADKIADIANRLRGVE